jgi:hypothetical protein
MAITKLNSQAIPPNTIVESDLSYPLTNFSSTGIDDNADALMVELHSFGTTPASHEIRMKDQMTVVDGVYVSSTGNSTLQLKGDSIGLNGSGPHTWNIQSQTTGKLEVGSSTGAGSNLLVIDTAGNVGINESAPDELLHVKGPDEAIIKIESTGSQFPTVYDGTPKLQLVPMATNGYTGEASIEASAPPSFLQSTGMWFRAARSDNATNGVYDGGYFTFHDGNQIVCNISDQGIQAPTFQSTSGGTTALTLSATGRVSTGEDLEVAGDISLPHSTAVISFGGETYGGPHGLNFLTDATGGAIHWGLYYRTSPETITLELDGTDKKLLLNTSGELHIDNDVIAFSTTTSDIRFKDQVETIDSALDKVMALRGVEYTWNATARKGERDMGLIAQEVEAVIPIIVREKTLSTGEWSDNPTPAKTVDYEKLTAVLIEAVKELKAEVDALKGGQ